MSIFRKKVKTAEELKEKQFRKICSFNVNVWKRDSFLMVGDKVWFSGYRWSDEIKYGDVGVVTNINSNSINVLFENGAKAMFSILSTAIRPIDPIYGPREVR